MSEDIAKHLEFVQEAINGIYPEVEQDAIEMNDI